jgi:hypothetical protein
VKTKQKQTGQPAPKRGRRKGQRALSIDPAEPLGTKLLKTVVGKDCDQEELRLVRRVLAAQIEYWKHVWPAVQFDITTPHPAKAELAKHRESARLARWAMERAEEELLRKAKDAITKYDSEFFCRIAKAVKHCETLRRQLTDARRYHFLGFVSQHLCPDGIAGNVTGIIHTDKTASDVRRHFREVLRYQEPSEKELSRWQRDCGVILTHAKPGRKPGSKNQHGE